MKIGFICKYPPLTGGVASRAYWLTRSLADRGHEIHIITNGDETERNYKELLSKADIEILSNYRNLAVHPTSSRDLPEIRPEYNPFEVKLANLALEIIKEHRLEVIDSWFLIPNSVAGFMVHQLTDIPWVVRHGGSDLGKHLVSDHFKTVLTAILKKADKIVTHANNKAIFESLGIPPENIWCTTYSLVNRKYFNGAVEPSANIPQDKPVIMAIGKIGEFKGTYDLLKAFAPLQAKAYLVFITGGPYLNKLEWCCRNLGISDNVKIFPPVPPWEVPAYIRAATCVVHVERNFAIPHYPILPREVIACKRCLLLSEEMHQKYPFLKKNNSVLVVDPLNHADFSAMLAEIIDNHSMLEAIAAKAYSISENIENYDDYLGKIEGLYQSLLN